MNDIKHPMCMSVHELLFVNTTCTLRKCSWLVAVMLDTHYYLREMATKSNNLHFTSPLVSSTLTSEVVIKIQASEELAESKMTYLA